MKERKKKLSIFQITLILTKHSEENNIMNFNGHK